MKNVCGINYLKSLIKEPTCFKNPDKPTCIDLILTNRPDLFQHSSAFDTGLSDFYLLTVTEFKMGFQKLKPKIIAYRDYRNWYLINGHFPDWAFPRLTLPRGQIPEWHFPDAHFSDEHFPEWIIPWLDISPTDTSPTEHFPTKTFPRPGISPTGHFRDHMF